MFLFIIILLYNDNNRKVFKQAIVTFITKCHNISGVVYGYALIFHREINFTYEEQIYNIFKDIKGKTARTSYILSLISFLDELYTELNWNLSKGSIIRLYLFKTIKGFHNYRDLSDYLLKNEEEAFQLGFYKNEQNQTLLPPKRTFNNYLKQINKRDLNLIAENILSIATKQGILLDLKVVSKAIKEKKKNYDLEYKEAVRLIKKLVYPQIDLKIGKNAKFSTKDFLDVLVHVAFSNGFANSGSATFKVDCNKENSPSGDLIFHHLSKFESIDEVRKMFEKISDFIFAFSRRDYNMLKDRKHEIAYDVHKIPYFGKNIQYTCGSKYERGTSNFLEFLTCSIVVAGRRFILDVTPIHPLDEISKLLDRSLTRVRNKIKIERAYLDRGFNYSSIFKILNKHKIRFLMPMVRSSTVKSAFDKALYTKSRIFRDFKVGDETVNLVLVDDEQGIKRAFVCNFDIGEPIAYRLYHMYSKRWGIETGYRNLDYDFQARTTTKNYHIRLFYFLFSTCLYNLWVLVNILVSLNIYGRISEKPLITAKMFAVLLYRVKERFDCGG